MRDADLRAFWHSECDKEITRLREALESAREAIQLCMQCNCKEYAAGPNMMTLVECEKCETLTKITAALKEG